MTPDELAARYRGYAAKCMVVAQKQPEASEKLALIDMAEAWLDMAQALLDLAEQARKDESTVVVYEMPRP